MKGFKRCNKGHFYKEGLDKCPYCPGGSASAHNGGNSDKTQIVGGGDTAGGADGNDKTQIFGGGGAAGGDDSTVVFGGGASKGGGRDLSKTHISGMDDVAEGEVATPRQSRKITGWIISYTIDAMGVDHRIYEGNNRIGKNPGREITVTTDSTVSSEHANILHKRGVWFLEDEMSSNGTFVNGEELKPRNPVEIKDNDMIKVGNTEFKFKTAL
jgi:hypothetical protein